MAANQLLDDGNYPEIDSSGIGDFHLLANKLRFVLFDWYKVDGVWVRRVTGMAKMPVTAIPADSVHFWRGVFAHAVPSEDERLPLH